MDWYHVNIFSHKIEKISDPIQIQIYNTDETNIIQKTQETLLNFYPHIDVKSFVHLNPVSVEIHNARFVNIFY